MGAVTLGAHTVVKQIIDFSQNIFGTFSTVAQTLVAGALGQGDRPTAQALVKRVLQLGFALGLCTSALLILAQVCFCCPMTAVGSDSLDHCMSWTLTSFQCDDITLKAC